MQYYYGTDTWSRIKLILNNRAVEDIQAMARSPAMLQWHEQIYDPNPMDPDFKKLFLTRVNAVTSKVRRRQEEVQSRRTERLKKGSRQKKRSQMVGTTAIALGTRGHGRGEQSPAVPGVAAIQYRHQQRHQQHQQHQLHGNQRPNHEGMQQVANSRSSNGVLNEERESEPQFSTKEDAAILQLVEARGEGVWLCDENEAMLLLMLGDDYALKDSRAYEWRYRGWICPL